MTRLVTFKEIGNFLGDVIKIRHATSASFEEGDTITGGTSSATAVVTAVNSNFKILYVVPTSDAFFSIGETITGSISGASSVLIPCEATFLDTAESSIKSFIDSYTNKNWGSTTSKTKKFTIEEYQRQVKLPAGVSITSITLDDSALTVDEDYYYNQDTGLIDFNEYKSAAATPFNLVVTYSDDQSSVPDSIKQAALILIAELWKMRNFNRDMKGAQNISFGGKSVSFMAPLQQTEIEALLPMVRSLLRANTRLHLL